MGSLLKTFGRVTTWQILKKIVLQNIYVCVCEWDSRNLRKLNVSFEERLKSHIYFTRYLRSKDNVFLFKFFFLSGGSANRKEKMEIEIKIKTNSLPFIVGEWNFCCCCRKVRRCHEYSTFHMECNNVWTKK